MSKQDPRYDPTTYGHKWIDIHTLSASIETRADVEPTVKAIFILISSIRCSKCKNHAEKYFEQNQLSKYYDKVDQQGRYIGLFDYFHQFHNAVNLRLNKPFMDYETALEMYFSHKSDCEEVCGV